MCYVVTQQGGAYVQLGQRGAFPRHGDGRPQWPHGDGAAPGHDPACTTHGRPGGDQPPDHAPAVLVRYGTVQYIVSEHIKDGVSKNLI